MLLSLHPLKPTPPIRPSKRFKRKHVSTSLPGSTLGKESSRPPLKINSNTYFKPVFLTLDRKSEGRKAHSPHDKHSNLLKGLRPFEKK